MGIISRIIIIHKDLNSGLSNEILNVEIQANVLKQAGGDMNLNVCQWQLDAVSNPIYFRKCVTVAGVRIGTELMED